MVGEGGGNESKLFCFVSMKETNFRFAFWGIYKKRIFFKSQFLERNVKCESLDEF